MIEASEIVPGLVLHLDPDTLEQQGGTFTCNPKFRAQGGHFFICLAVQGSTGTWIPVYSNDGVGRTLLTTGDRIGHTKWTNGTFYWHKNQVWSAPHEAIIAASENGLDQSTPEDRNLLAVSALPNLA